MCNPSGQSYYLVGYISGLKFHRISRKHLYHENRVLYRHIVEKKIEGSTPWNQFVEAVQ